MEDQKLEELVTARLGFEAANQRVPKLSARDIQQTCSVTTQGPQYP